jgi:hypothetical protein
MENDKISIHIHAIRWALAQGYVMSVTDLCADDDEWDCEYSADEAEITACCSATDIPNAYIFEKVDCADGRGAGDKDSEGNCYRHISTFSVIDEGVPEETINDYTIGAGADEFDQAMNTFYEYYR